MSVRKLDALLVAGAGGMLGTATVALARSRGIAVMAPEESDFDITDSAQVRRVAELFAATLGPTERGALVNAGAYTNVEAAEDHRDLAFAVNADAPRLLAQAARDTGLAFAHVSTDFVFDGAKDGAYVETDATNPLSVYGVSKLAGELAVAETCSEALTVRTAWTFGAGNANFPGKIVAAARRDGSVRVVTDEVGSPTYAPDLAAGILGLLEAEASGLYHLAGSGSCSRYELAVETLRLAGIDAPVEPVTSDAFPTKAARPHNSVLDCSKAAALGVVMRDWHVTLAQHLSAPG